MSGRKAVSRDNVNGELCAILMELAEHERVTTRNPHKHRAYRNAAAALAEHHKKIQSGAEARRLRGVGQKIAEKIDEFLSSGALRKLERIREDPSARAAALLSRVSGVGPVTAAELVRQGIHTIQELRRHTDKLNHHQLLGLKYFDDFEKKIPRSEVEEIEKIVKSKIAAVDPEYEVTVCGSYRRGALECGDIDVLVTHPTAAAGGGGGALLSLLGALGSLVTDTLSLGDTKFMGVCRLSPDAPARRMDMRLVPAAAYACSLLYFTGSEQFNRDMRAHATHRGFTLNEYSLRPIGVTGVAGEPVPVCSEEDVFDYLQLPYRAPTDRNAH